jgi:hypothetical protein
LEGLGAPKALKNQWFFKEFANAGFRYFEARPKLNDTTFS